jgi:DNA ligase (NAD+)
MTKNQSMSDQERMEILKRELNFHNYRYHVLDSPVISDLEFDRMMNELKKIEIEHPEWITPDSPTQRTGGIATAKFAKIRHPKPILSLGNAFNPDGIRAWYERVLKLDNRVAYTKFVVEPKIDGLTVILTYRDGFFVQGATRGDGEIGEDVTSNLRTILTIPLKIPVDGKGPKAPSEIVVRGEVFMYVKDFEALNKRLEGAGEKIYLNPRNTAAGSIRQLDPSLTAARPLRLLSYAIVSGEGNLPTTQWETLQFLRKFGFPVWNTITLCEDIDQVISVCETWQFLRSKLPFEIDGMVIKINDLNLADDLGFVGKDPRGALAYKFPAQEVITRLVDIGVNVGRTGVLTPYAILDPVEIGGVIVKQATLHNFDFISDKDIRIGDQVRVIRAGEVIPYVIGPVPEARSGDEKPYQQPESCPACNEPVEHIEGEVAWYCVNSSCPEQLIRNVEHFVSRGTMDIVGLGIKIVEQLIAAGLVHDVADLYTLSKEDLLSLEGFAEKKAENVLQSIQNSRTQPLNRFITALGIRGVGNVMATDLTRFYSNLDTLSKAGIGDLQLIEGIGPNVAQSIVDWFSRPANQKLLEKFKQAGLWPVIATNIEDEELPMVFSGYTFVITGVLPTLSREDAAEYIQSRGGKVTNSVSKNTNYLVLGENPGSKFEKAKSIGITILDEQGLRRLAREID